MKHINLVGVELEGGWNPSPVPKPSNNISCHGDGSVHVSEEDLTVGGVTTDPTFVGELVTREPMSLENVLVFVAENYPQYVNKTCGLHVHISTKTDDEYRQLMSPKFGKRFQEWAEQLPLDLGLSKTHRYWERLRGGIQYCTPGFTPMAQVDQVHKGSFRYKHLNFCHALHGTLECRLLPMFVESATAVAAIKSYVEMVEKYLGDNKPTDGTLFKEVLVQEVTKAGDVRTIYV